MATKPLLIILGIIYFNRRKQQKKALAQKLLEGELGSSDLTDTETDEMIDYFKNDIENMDQELQRIKLHIIEMRKELMEN